MNRRTLFASMTAVAVWPGAVGAQSARVPRIGVLVAGKPDPARFLELFREALRGLGYVDGRTIAIEVLSAEGNVDALPGLAAQLVRQKVDIIVGWQTPVITVVAQATREIPIVMAAAGDPVASGLIASLARPGGNITGYSNASAELSAKSVELVHELLPAVKRMALLLNSADPFHTLIREHVARTGRTLGLDIDAVMIAGPDALEAAFAELGRNGTGAIIVQPTLPIDRVAELALRHRLPSASASNAFTLAGGLLSYLGSPVEQYRRVAGYIDKILKGAKPGSLPVEQPITFELTINMKTARAIGLTIPPSLFARADEVIE
ncbi:MAG: ABC transporter substrate-binding protein [Alphaproteobacteria bacterium]|jgi:putative ABC transport system substrate-binding protein